MKLTTVKQLKKLLQEEEIRLKNLRERVKRYRKKKENLQLDLEEYLEEILERPLEAIEPLEGDKK